MYAAGDATWFPIKQGGLAAQQADVAATSIASPCGRRDREGSVPPGPAWRPADRGGASLRPLRGGRSRRELSGRRGAAVVAAQQDRRPLPRRRIWPRATRIRTPPLDDRPSPARRGAGRVGCRTHQEAVELALTVADAGRPLEGLPRGPTLARSRGAARTSRCPRTTRRSGARGARPCGKSISQSLRNRRSVRNAPAGSLDLRDNKVRESGLTGGEPDLRAHRSRSQPHSLDYPCVVAEKRIGPPPFGAPRYSGGFVIRGTEPGTKRRGWPISIGGGPKGRVLVGASRRPELGDLARAAPGRGATNSSESAATAGRAAEPEPLGFRRGQRARPVRPDG